MNKYFWCEDSGAGYTFWTTLFQVINPNVIVQSKHNNTELRKAVSSISSKDDQYYIAMDVVMDNPDVVREMKKLSEIVKGKNNVHLVKIHSFEVVLLSFDDFEAWIFAQDDELKENRKDLLKWRKLFLNAIININEKELLDQLKVELNYKIKYNTEQIAAHLLEDITKNTGFETTKGTVGECFINDCCKLQARQSDDICGLDEIKLSRNEKMQQIYEKSILKTAFTGIGI